MFAAKITENLQRGLDTWTREEATIIEKFGERYVPEDLKKRIADWNANLHEVKVHNANYQALNAWIQKLLIHTGWGVRTDMHVGAGDAVIYNACDDDDDVLCAFVFSPATMNISILVGKYGKHPGPSYQLIRSAKYDVETAEWTVSVVEPDNEDNTPIHWGNYIEEATASHFVDQLDEFLEAEPLPKLTLDVEVDYENAVVS